MQMVISPNGRTCLPNRRIDVSTGKRREKRQAYVNANPKMEIREAALNSETIWMRSAGFQHPSDGKVCAYDWLASISDKGCAWQSVLAGSDEAIRALALKRTENALALFSCWTYWAWEEPQRPKGFLLLLTWAGVSTNGRGGLFRWRQNRFHRLY